MIRIAQILPNLRYGGTEMQFACLMAALPKETFETCVITLDEPGDLAEKVQPHTSEIISVKRVCAFDPAAVVRVRRYLKEWAPDLLHAWLLPGIVYGGLAGNNLPSIKARLASVRGVGFSPKGSTLKERFAIPFFDRILHHRFDGFLTNSQAVTDYLKTRKMDENRITEIPNGLLLDGSPKQDAGQLRRELGLPEDARVIGFVGRMEEQKSLDMLLRTMRVVAASRKEPLHLLLVGEGPLREEWTALAQSLGIEAQCTWTGFRRDLENLYSVMDLFCLPSRFGEGLSNAILEALAHGVPVVASDAPGTGEILERTGGGICFRSGDLESFRSILDHMLSRLEDAKHTAHLASRRVKEYFGVEKMAAAHAEIYQSLCMRDR